MSIRSKRGTQAQVDAAAGAGQLTLGEIILITDASPKRLVVATSTSTYVDMGTGGSSASVGDLIETTDMSSYIVDDGGTYLRTDGSLVPANVYPDLFAEIGHDYYSDGLRFLYGTLSSLSSAITAAVRDFAWSPDGKTLTVVASNWPGLHNYTWDNGSLTLLPDPDTTLVDATDGGEGVSAAWSPDSRYLAASGSKADLYIYDYSSGNLVFQYGVDSPFGASFNPANDMDWSPNGQYLAMAQSSAPYLSVLNMSNTPPTLMANAATVPTGIGNDCAWSPNGQYLTVAHDNTPYVSIYNWATGAPVKIANPTTLPTGNADAVVWSPSGRYMAVGHNNSPYVTIYDWANGTPVKIANPSTLPAGSISSVDWSSSGRYLAVGVLLSPRIMVYDFANGTPVALSAPATIANNSTMAVSWSPSGTHLLLGTSGPYYGRVYPNASLPDYDFYLPSIPVANGVNTLIKATDKSRPWTHLTVGVIEGAAAAVKTKIVRLEENITIHFTVEITVNSGADLAIDQQWVYSGGFGSNRICTVNSSNVISYVTRSISGSVGSRLTFEFQNSGFPVAGKLIIRRDNISGEVIEEVYFSLTGTAP